MPLNNMCIKGTHNYIHSLLLPETVVNGYRFPKVLRGAKDDAYQKNIRQKHA